MNTIGLLAIGLASILVLGAFVFTYVPRAHQTTNTVTALPDANAFEPIARGSASVSSVGITLEPRIENDRLVVAYQANTHGGNLADYDLMQAAWLDTGTRRIAPSAADAMVGHHARGTIVFERPNAAFSIHIEGIPDVEDRVYTWSGSR